VLVAASLIAIALSAGCGEFQARTAVGRPRPVTVAVAGPVNALYASLYAASADGDFRLGALAVTITHPAHPLRSLESGAAAVAILSEPQLLAARAQGAQLVAIGALVGGPLDAVVSLATRPITTAAALAGATMARLTDPLGQAELRTMLATAHLTPASVHPAPTRDLKALLGGGAANAVWAFQWPPYVASLALAHRQASVLEVQRAGVPTYSGLVVVVRVGEAHHDAPLLRAFLQALTRGQRAVAARPAAIAATLAKVNPQSSAAFERALLAQLAPLSAPVSAGEPFGWQNPADWQTFGAWLRTQGLAGGTADGGLAITDEFLPGQGE